jgi:hypothetical protein
LIINRIKTKYGGLQTNARKNPLDFARGSDRIRATKEVVGAFIYNNNTPLFSNAIKKV